MLMARPEKESQLLAPVTIKRPTVMDFSRLLKNPHVSITCIGKSHQGILYDVIDRNRSDEISRKLEGLDQFTKLRGEIIVHESITE